MKKLSFFLATAVLTMALASCGGNNIKTTATLNDELDSINYAFGVASGSQFRQQVFYGEKDTAKLESFHKAFLSGFNANFKKMSESKMQELSGTSAGMNLTMEIKDGFIFGDSTWTAKKELINKSALEIINGKEEVGGFTAQTAQEFYFRINRERRDAVPFEMTPEKLDSLNVAFAIMMASRHTRDLNDEKRAGFVKGFKSGLSITDAAKRYKVTGSYIAAQGFEILSKSGLMGDSTLTLRPEQMVAGINAGILSDETIMTQEAAFQYIRQVSEARRQAQIIKLYGKNIEEGAQFLAENAKREGVKVTESGLQYEVIKEGKGAKPAATDIVKVHYHGTLIDGTVFDSSVERGESISFPLNGVIAGWTEGVQLMPVGSKYRFFIPYPLAYGEQGAGGAIEPYSTLIFDVELLGIEKPEPPKANISNMDLRIQ